jgi:hypothetical protein
LVSVKSTKRLLQLSWWKRGCSFYSDACAAGSKATLVEVSQPGRERPSWVTVRLRSSMAKNAPPEFRDRRDWSAIEAWAQKIAAALANRSATAGSQA